jgi:hypothetical protein
MPFCHLTKYCRSNTAADIANIHKASASPTRIKYKFDNQVTKGIMHTIEVYKKNGNQLWEVSIKTELKQLTDYQAFHCTVFNGIYSNRISENFLPKGF